MKFSQHPNLFSLVLGGILAFSHFQNISAQTTFPSENDAAEETQPDAALFVPLDSFPDFADVRTVAWQYVDHFEKIGTPFSQCSFYDVPGVAGVALSDHVTTWDEFAQFLKSAATLYSSKHPDTTPHGLWTSEMEPYITREVVRCQISGSIFSTQEFSYDTVPEHTHEPAMLPAAVAQRYVNWRNVHLWLYHQLKREEAVIHEQQIAQEPDDSLTSCFRKKGLYPPIDVVNNIDHIDEILSQSTEVGSFWFSKNGNSLERIDAQAPFFLPTNDQKESWTHRYAEEFSLQGILWTAESLNNSAALPEKRAVQLAVHKEIMMQGEGVEAEEARLRGMVHDRQQGLILLQSSNEYQQASQREQSALTSCFLNGVGVLSLLLAVGDIYTVLKATSELRNLISSVEMIRCVSVCRLIHAGEFSMQDCIKANELIQARHASAAARELFSDTEMESIPRGYYNTADWNTPIFQKKYKALAQVYKNRYDSQWSHAQWSHGLQEGMFSLCCFYFGNSSNIDCNY